MTLISALHVALPVDHRTVDIAIGFIGLLVAIASVWLQWSYFTKTYPKKVQPDATRSPFAQTNPRNRWRMLYWREVRATLFLALLSLLLVVAVVIFYGSVTLISLASLMFWLGMFFYNLWVAQWYAWRIATKRKR